MGFPPGISYWADFDWDIITHVVCYGTVDTNMMYTARAHGAKVLRTFLIDSGGTMGGMSDSAVRAKMTQNALSLSAIPPHGRYNAT
eukprot:COSAG04_NODE_14734_length_557_cov_0.722707_2_plen_85_part_01